MVFNSSGSSTPETWLFVPKSSAFVVEAVAVVVAAMVVVDSVTRLLPGVLGCSASAENDTFSRSLLKHPQYTRPQVFEGQDVPEELLSGDHARIARYRFIASVQRTIERRPDLIRMEHFSPEEQKTLKRAGLDKIIEQLRDGQDHRVRDKDGS